MSNTPLRRRGPVPLNESQIARSGANTMKVACIDLEGVLVPELWPHISRHTGIATLNRTTREEPDYPKLMRARIEALRENNLRLSDVRAIVSMLQPYRDARRFLDVLARDRAVFIVSDCFEELAESFFLPGLGYPRLMAHRLDTDADGFITQCRFAQRQGKQEVVNTLVRDGIDVLAVGDALNDIGMLKAATYGYLLRPSPATIAVAGDLPVADSLAEVWCACSKTSWRMR